jgi:HEAT repeat protein
LAQARLLDQCISECGDHLATEAFAECVWIAQSLTPLPWFVITAYDAVCIGLERLPDDKHSREILTLVHEIRNRCLTLPEGVRPGKKRFFHGLPKALDALESSHAITRWAALWVLAVAGDKAPALQVAPLLADPDPAIRGMAAWLLSVLEHKSSRVAIRKLLLDQDWMVRKAAASSLGRLEDASAFDELLNLAQKDRAEVRRSAAWGLSRLALAEQVLPYNILRLKDFFVQLIDSSDPDLVTGGCSGIAGLAKAGVANLHDLLPRIQALMDHADTGVCHSAAYAIAAMAEPGDLPLIQSMATNPDANLRASAASGLGRLKQADSAPLLVKLLTDRDGSVQGVALSVLDKLFDQQLVEAELINAIKTVDEPTVARLMSGLVKRDDHKTANSDRALAYRERDAIKAALQDRALPLLESPQPNTRAIACFVLSQLPDKRAVDPCLSLLSDEDSRVRASALNVLQRLPDKRAIVPGLKLLKDDDPGVRASACGLAAKLSLPLELHAAVLRTLQNLTTDPDERVVRSAKFAIRALTPRMTPRR